MFYIFSYNNAIFHTNARAKIAQARENITDKCCYNIYNIYLLHDIFSFYSQYPELVHADDGHTI